MADAPPKRRCIVYIDGFNLYHSLLKHTKERWLNIETFFQSIRNEDDVRRLYFFTSPPPSSLPDHSHKAYMKALGTLPLVTVVEGARSLKEMACPKPPKGCGRKFTHMEEKQTDVAIAVQMVMDAGKNEADLLVLVSGDTDLVPAVRAVRDEIKKPVFVYVPVHNERDKYKSMPLQNAGTKSALLPTRFLSYHQFDDRHPDGKGGFISKPSDW